MKVKTSFAIDDLKGSAGNVTAARNRGGLYFKTRINPSNPQTSSQQKIRNAFGVNSRAWGELTQEQRQAWIEFSDTLVGKSNFGLPTKLSGINVYSRCNNNLALVGGTLLDSPVAAPEMPIFDITGITFTQPVDETPGKIEVSVDGLDSLSGFKIVAMATAPFSAGRIKNSSSLRVIGFYDSLTDGSVDVASSYGEKFGVFPAAGSKIEVSFYLVHEASGFASLKQNFVSLV